MRLKFVYVCTACLLTCAAAVYAQRQSAADPLTGTWTGDWGPTPTHRNAVTVQLKWDGKVLAGTVNPGPNAVKLQKTSYNASAGSVHMEADAGAMGKRIHYVIEGKIENGLMFGTWNHEDKKGDFRLLRK